VSVETSRRREAVAPPPYAAGSEVEHFETFCRDHLIQSVDRWAGEPLVLYPAQREFFNEALAYDEHGLPIWESVVQVMPRKNGKTVGQAAYALYRLLTDDGMPEILLAAASDRQAGRLFDACAAFARRSRTLSRLLRVRDYVGEIVREDGRGKILRMSSDPARLYGYSPSLVVCDEVGQWTTPSLERAYAALTSGGGARSAPQVFTISTAGEAHRRHDSILGRLLDAAEAASDQYREPGLLVARIPAARTLVWAYEAPTADPRDVKAMKIANPAPWITEQYLAREAANPELSDAAVLQLHGCVWAESSDTWISRDDWMARAGRGGRPDPGERIVIGFDGSYNRDATALIGCTFEGHLFVIKIWERPADAPDDWKVPRGEVDAELAAAMEEWDVVELACDPPGWHREIEDWELDYERAVVVQFETRRPGIFVPACDRFRSAVLEGGLTHDGDPVLARHVTNAVARETSTGVVVGKAERGRHVDACIAAVVAFERMCWRRERDSGFVVEMVPPAPPRKPTDWTEDPSQWLK
jgi:phage terminase large subunit-like protein